MALHSTVVINSITHYASVVAVLKALLNGVKMWLIVVYFLYAIKGKANHNTKKEDAGAMKERHLPCTIVLHSSNE
eukprot:6682827-Ditylum_brightwellii.AAC.2